MGRETTPPACGGYPSLERRGGKTTPPACGRHPSLERRGGKRVLG